MADLAKLRTELTTDPLTRGYSGMTAAQVIASLNTANRTRARALIPSYEIVNAIVPADWAALTDKTAIQLIISAGSVDPNNSNVSAAFLAAFGAGTTTRANLIAIRNETVSRAVELGLGDVHTGDVNAARS